jgi:2-amino-4-hydroxy-6-hydroxymethyldihydropteridine diphosphokinase
VATAFIAMGANLGDRARSLSSAAASLGEQQGVRIVKGSRVYETAPVGVADQPEFLNAVLQVETDLSPRALMDLLLQVERQSGRIRRQKWGPRTLDLDLLLYGNRVIREPGLEVPHPHLHERGFVLVPLCDLCPDWRHPVLKKTFRTLEQSLGDCDGIRQAEGISLLPDG